VEPAPFAEVKECFPAVAEQIRRHGGTQVLGWQLWQTKFLVEAEFHAVWCAPDGSLHDITPKQLRTAKILFLPDPDTVYQGANIDNVRLNSTGNAICDDFIKACEAVFYLENKGERAHQREVELLGKEAVLHGFLVKMRAGTNEMLRDGLTEKSPCPCDSQRTYEECHGPLLKKMFAELTSEVASE
jgi:hypothetical protein